jgi:hypothetical protein
MIVCVLAVVLKGYNNSYTAVTQGYSHPCNCSAQRALVGTATRLIRDERYRRVAVVLEAIPAAPACTALGEYDGVQQTSPLRLLA